MEMQSFLDPNQINLASSLTNLTFDMTSYVASLLPRLTNYALHDNLGLSGCSLSASGCEVSLDTGLLNHASLVFAWELPPRHRHR
jgi:hypothetical protein